MAKIIAPLLSLEAKGTYAGVLTFSRHKGVSTARKKRISIAPPDPKTPIQLFNRDYFKSIVATWKALTTSDKETLDNLTIGVAYSGFNLYVKSYHSTLPTECGNTRCGVSELGGLTILP